MTYEMLSMDELDRVSGGTWKEYDEIADLLPKIPEKWQDVKGTTYDGFRLMTPEEVQKWLKENLGITATLHDGFILDPTDDAGDSNLYKLDSTGKYISHEETMAMIKDFLKDK